MQGGPAWFNGPSKNVLLSQGLKVKPDTVSYMKENSGFYKIMRFNAKEDTLEIT